jgi:hypothetical protein
MAISDSAVANRHALRSDYYSTKKKTANPLNEWWTTNERGEQRSARRLAHPRGAVRLTASLSRFRRHS